MTYKSQRLVQIILKTLPNCYRQCPVRSCCFCVEILDFVQDQDCSLLQKQKLNTDVYNLESEKFHTQKHTNLKTQNVLVNFIHLHSHQIAKLLTPNQNKQKNIN